MAKEYVSREAAIEKITALINKSGNYTDYECGADDACFIVEHVIPAADVVEVVRCLECKKAVLEDQGNGKTALWCPVNRNYRCRDEFCNRGERCDI